MDRFQKIFGTNQRNLLSYPVTRFCSLMAYSIEDLEQQRRSIAMTRPGTVSDVRMSLVREVALSTLAHAMRMTQLSMADGIEEDVA